MTGIAQEMPEDRAVRLSHVAPVFARTANHLLLSLRRAMGVPDQAEPEVEQEFAALRASLDQQFRPEFDKMYAGLLAHYVGAANGVVLDALEDPSVQAYLAVSDRIGGELDAALRACVGRLEAILSPPVSG